MTEALSSSKGWLMRAAPVSEPGIVLHWLTRLRWLAVVGQIAATGVATALLGQGLALGAIAVVIGVTILTNGGLVWWMRSGRIPGWVVPGVIALDVGLLTAMLYFTGGAENPFSILYVVHVAMSVVVLGAGWTWGIAGLAVGAYAILLRWHVPLTQGEPLAGWVARTGNFAAMALVAGLIAYFIGRVVTSLRRREAELTAMRERAVRNEQLAALATLAAGAAHELGTPLGTIAVVAKEMELAAKSLNGDGALVEDARLVRGEVDRCRRILDRMRVDIVEDLKQRVSRVKAEELVEELVFDLTAEERARLEVRCEAAEISVPVRAVQQAVGVLLRNAFDASEEGQRVKLSVGREEGRVVFEVEDQGSGMPEEVVRRAGEPFFTTKAPGEGMGLGLFLVRLVAEKYGGAFRLESRVGVGTRGVLEVGEGGK